MLAGQNPRHWLALALLIGLGIAFAAYQWHSALSRRRQESVLSSLSFSHGLSIGQPFESKSSLIARLAERGYEYEREVEKGHYEFRDATRTLLLRVKEHERQVSAVYLFALPGHPADVSGPDLLGLTRKELGALVGKPRRKEMSSKNTRPDDDAGRPARTLESWYYLARTFDLTVGFDRSGHTIEVILQVPIGR